MSEDTDKSLIYYYLIIIWFIIIWFIIITYYYNSAKEELDIYYIGTGFYINETF